MKKLLSGVLVVVVLLLSLTASYAAAPHKAYYKGEAVYLAPITMSNEAGAEVSSVPSGGDVTFKTRAFIADGSSALSLQFIAASYNDGVFVRSSYETYDLSGCYAKDLTVSVSADNADEIRAYVIDSFTNARPLAEKTIFGDSAIGISGIKIDGVALPDFDAEITDYDYLLPARYFDIPVISPVIDNQAIVSEISYSGAELPLEIGEEATVTITLKSPDKQNTKTYTITFTQELPVISDIVLKSNTKTEGTETVTYTAISNYGINENIRDIEYTETPAVTPVAREKHPEYNSSVFGYTLPYYVDRGYPITGIPEFLYGATYINFDYQYNNTYPGKSSDMNDGISISINRDADVYVIGGSNWCTDKGYKASGITLYRLVADATAGTFWPETDVCVQSFEVKEDKLILDIGPSRGVIVKFHDKKSVSNGKIYGGTETVSAPIVKVAEPAYMVSTDIGYTEGENKISSSTQTVSDKTYYIKDISENLIGSYAVTFPYSFRNTYPDTAKDTENKNFASFDLTATSEVYIFYPVEQLSDIAWMEREGYVAVDPSEYSFNLVAGAKEYLSGTVFKKVYSVTPGETLNVTMGGFPTAVSSVSRVPLTVFVKPL